MQRAGNERGELLRINISLLRGTNLRAAYGAVTSCVISFRYLVLFVFRNNGLQRHVNGDGKLRTMLA